ncbi:MAG: glutaredoxin family protein [Chloroflexi bacterium]|nr:glutaredoxin family protein [Chloroflexota bacterium]
MTTSPAVVYCRPRCPGCGALIGWLDEHHVAWVTRDVLADATAADRVTRLGYRSLPVVEMADGRSAWGGDLDAVAALFAVRPGSQQSPTAAHAGPGASDG